MFGTSVGMGVAGWMAMGAALALVVAALRQKLAERREARLRGDWDSY